MIFVAFVFATPAPAPAGADNFRFSFVIARPPLAISQASLELPRAARAFTPCPPVIHVFLSL